MPETTAIITALIIGRPMCLDCITRRAAVGVAAAEVTLARINNVLALQREQSERCRACGTIGVVFSVIQP